MIAWVFPGQGSQRAGMGAALFDRYPECTKAAGDLLGWSVREVCLSDDGRLDQTEFTQPALFVVNALSCADRRAEGAGDPDFLAGHSLGELNALHAAGSVDFRTGLGIAARRGELMSRCAGGGMAVVLGMSEPQVRDVLAGGRGLGDRGHQRARAGGRLRPAHRGGQGTGGLPRRGRGRLREAAG